MLANKKFSWTQICKNQSGDSRSVGNSATTNGQRLPDCEPTERRALAEVSHTGVTSSPHVFWCLMPFLTISPQKGDKLLLLIWQWKRPEIWSTCVTETQSFDFEKYTSCLLSYSILQPHADLNPIHGKGGGVSLARPVQIQFENFAKLSRVPA